MLLKDLAEVFNYYTREDIDAKFEAIPKGEQGPQGERGPKGEPGPQGESGAFDDTATFEALQTVNQTVIGAINELKAQIGYFKLWVGTKEEYDAIALKDSDTLYFVKGE